MTDAKRVILLYNFSAERAKLVRAVTAPLGCGVRVVSKKEQNSPVGSFAGVGGINAAQKKTPSAGFEDEFIVICGYTGVGLDVVLDALRTSGVGRKTLKAVLTGANASWSGAQLYEEVKKEHELMTMTRSCKNNG